MERSLTYPEWLIMSALWDKPPQALSEVVAALSSETYWKYRTYASYLRNLCEKGLVGFNIVRGDKYYYALVNKADCMRLESRNLIKKVSGKSAKDLLVCMIEESTLTPEDHLELKKILETLSKGSD